MTTDQPPDLDAVLSLLADGRRRALLSHLLENEFVTIETLARRIGAIEAETTPRAVDGADIERIGISLVHDDLPRLADHGILEFDARSGDVVRANGFETLRPILERVHGDPDTSPPETSLLSVLYSDPPEERFLADDA